MFSGESLNALITRLDQRGAYIWHACQFQDFCSYLALGGIPSRALLERASLPFTPFETDGRDRTNGVWDKVFVNLSDFGRAFAGGKNATPNAFGPITLRLPPAALRAAVDVAICLRSAGGRDFDRTAESIKTIHEVDQLFAYAMDAPAIQLSWLKSTPKLRKRWPSAHTPEISCATTHGVIPFVECDVIVDPHFVHGTSLEGAVLTAVSTSEHASRMRVLRRYCGLGRDDLYTELGALVFFGMMTIEEVGTAPGRSVLLNEWLDKATESTAFQFTRFAKYLYSGTIAPILSAELDESYREGMMSDIQEAEERGHEEEDGNLQDDAEADEFEEPDDTFGGTYMIGSDDPPEPMDEELHEGFVDETEEKDDGDYALDDSDDSLSGDEEEGDNNWQGR